jgi:hypothetical protein
MVAPVRPSLAILALFALPTLAHAGAVRCRLEHGVLVAPAEVAGVAGDFIIDTGQAATALAETQAQAAGFDGPVASGAARFSGQQIADRAFLIQAIDARSQMFDTPIAGVIGADILRGLVVDVRFSPCWIAARPPGTEPTFKPSLRLPIAWRGGAPTIQAAVSDGPTARVVALRLSTGLDAPMSLSTALAQAPGPRASLRALSFAQALYESLATRLEDPGDADGAVGAGVLARFRIRFDFPRSVIELAPR